VAPPIRILIADDHPVMRAAISEFLGIQDDMVVVGQASNGGEAVEMARELKPNVILMDYQMPEKDGVAATKEIHSADPNMVVISFSIYEGERVRKNLLEAGAVFHVSKHSDNAALLTAIREHARKTFQ
jgi:DNA-binding NarL/FixJ family response regulator